jgi:hypothetical protein
MRVAAVLRFEGETDPDDEAIVFALECKEHGVKGTYTVAYGSNTPPADIDLVRRLGSAAVYAPGTIAVNRAAHTR